ncbi:major facilitator superfamily domain-containing protein 9 [Carcharodon carcharias]|uniref:major facilitator superfamily domain-containing protein 9 n=1 Tax=Carcharodon carcharias TaxID=13397 RepID=UPI001B7E5E12|nr:major facilitator superfamily domain-containing protein 9 [Carcharodon carcharias]
MCSSTCGEWADTEFYLVGTRGLRASPPRSSAANASRHAAAFQTMRFVSSHSSHDPGRRALMLRLYLVGFLDLFGVSMVVPLLSRHIKLLGGSSTVAGLVGSVYGLLQLFSSTVIGSWSDVVGRRNTLLITLILSGFSYSLLGISGSIPLLILARIPTGIFKHTQSILKALLSDLIPEHERPQVMGRLSAASSVGFILGPVLSGYLVELDGGYHTASFMCSLIFLVNAGVAWRLPHKEWLYIPTKKLHLTTEMNCETKYTTLWKEKIRNSTTDPAVTATNGMARHKTLNSVWSQCLSVRENIKVLIHSNLWDVFLVRFLMALASLLYYSNFVLAVEERFKVTPRLIGYLISYSGVIGVLSSFIAGPVTRLYNNKMILLLLHSSILTCCMMAMYSVATSIQVVVLCSTVLRFSTTIGRMCIIDMGLSQGGGQARGTLIGAGQSVTAVARLLAPLLSGIVQEFSVCGPPRLGAAIALMAIFLMTSMHSKLNKTTEAKVKLH